LVTEMGRREPENIGFQFLEDPRGFTSLHREYFHFYHFLEFCTVAFIELQRFKEQNEDATIAWIYVPHMTLTQIHGHSNLNSLVVQLIFGNHVTIHGTESNNNKTVRALMQQPLPQRYYDSSQSVAMMEHADSVLTISRPACKDPVTNKLWTNHMAHFPAQTWHTDVSRRLEVLSPSPPPPKKEHRAGKKAIIRIGYIDRQSTARRLPRSFHKWILSYLSKFQQTYYKKEVTIDFRHLRMERMSPIQQIQAAAKLDILVGVHGNGLSHMFFMKPGGYVMEIFWECRFQFDYASAAQMMTHRYFAIHNGLPINLDRVARLDPVLREELPKSRVFYANKTALLKERVRSGAEAAASFFDTAIAELTNHDAR